MTMLGASSGQMRETGQTAAPLLQVSVGVEWKRGYRTLGEATDKREVSGWTKKAAGWPVGRAGPPKPPALKSKETLGCRSVTSSGTGRVSREVHPQIMWLSRGAGGAGIPWT